jgi:LacI family transcriptional regulator
MRSIKESMESVKINSSELAKKPLKFERSCPTLVTVAREAGVAVSTASAILAKKKHCYASEETYARVHHVAKNLGYRPNRFARSLRGAKTNFIGVIFPELSSPSIMLNKLLALEEIAYKEGFRVMFGTHRGDPCREREYLFEFLANNVDGIIFNSDMRDNAEVVQQFLCDGLPIVTIESPFDFAIPDVTIDRELGGYLQVKHIIQDAKRKHIVFMRGSSLWSGGQAKIRGQNKALQEFESSNVGHVVIDHPDVGPNPFDAGRKMAKELLETKAEFDAVITSADSLALGVMHELTKIGLRIPEDVAIIGFDDEDFAAALPVPLSTIHQPRDAGISAWELLRARMSDSPNLPENCPKRVLLPHLVVRESTCGNL